MIKDQSLNGQLHFDYMVTQGKLIDAHNPFSCKMGLSHCGGVGSIGAVMHVRRSAQGLTHSSGLLPTFGDSGLSAPLGEVKSLPVLL